MRPLALVALLGAACAGDGEQGNAGSDFFDAEVAEVFLEVDYQTGAEPFTDFRVRAGSPWRLLDDNLEALFTASPRRLVIPETLSEMEELMDVAGSAFTSDDLLEIAAHHRGTGDDDERRTLYIVFVDGVFADEQGERPEVLGVSIGDTGVIGIFKPVVAGGGVADRFVEQTTLIHEVGHAVGLVANGLPLTSAHHDAENGAHCTNPDCVMYYLNEGLSDAIDFAEDYLASGETVVFGPECLADAQAAAQASP